MPPGEISRRHSASSRCSRTGPCGPSAAPFVCTDMVIPSTCWLSTCWLSTCWLSTCWLSACYPLGVLSPRPETSGPVRPDRRPRRVPAREPAPVKHPACHGGQESQRDSQQDGGDGCGEN